MSHAIEHIIISRALEFIADRRRWTRFVPFRSANGKICSPASSPARFCAFAALVRAGQDLGLEPDEIRRAVAQAERRIQRANRWPDGTRIAHVNDRHGHAAIVKSFRKALDA